MTKILKNNENTFRDCLTWCVSPWDVKHNKPTNYKVSIVPVSLRVHFCRIIWYTLSIILCPSQHQPKTKRTYCYIKTIMI